MNQNHWVLFAYLELGQVKTVRVNIKRPRQGQRRIKPLLFNCLLNTDDFETIVFVCHRNQCVVRVQILEKFEIGLIVIRKCNIVVLGSQKFPIRVLHLDLGVLQKRGRVMMKPGCDRCILVFSSLQIKGQYFIINLEIFHLRRSIFTHHVQVSRKAVVNITRILIKRCCRVPTCTNSFVVGLFAIQRPRKSKVIIAQSGMSKKEQNDQADKKLFEGHLIRRNFISCFKIIKLSIKLGISFKRFIEFQQLNLYSVKPIYRKIFQCKLIKKKIQFAKLKVFSNMKKLLDIICLDELNQCHQSELDFKTQRNNLKRYLKSLKELKSRVKANHQYFANLVQDTNRLADEQGNLKKKNSELDYYMLNGVKPFRAFHLKGKKLNNFYESCFNQTKNLIEKIIKYLDQSKESFNRVSKQHEKVVKQYAEKCFPQTSSILYMMGFVSTQKIRKVEDTMKQQSLLKETQMYEKILNTFLDQMEGLQYEAKSLFEQYYLGAAELWVSCCEDLKEEMKTYKVNDDDIEHFYKETGGASTDRSDRSNKGNDQEQI